MWDGCTLLLPSGWSLIYFMGAVVQFGWTSENILLLFMRTRELDMCKEDVYTNIHSYFFWLIDAGYLACARCSSTGALVLVEPVSTFDGGNQPLSLPKTDRCSNCSGAGKVGHLTIWSEKFLRWRSNCRFSLTLNVHDSYAYGGSTALWIHG